MNYLQRKKLAFMSIVNKIKGFVRMVSDIPPLTLQKCVDEKSLIDYKIYGDTYPNADNLFNTSEWFPNYLNDKGGMTYSNKDFSAIHKIKILEGQFEENTVYTFSVDYKITNYSEYANKIALLFKRSDNTTISITWSSGAVTTGTYSGTISVTNLQNEVPAYALLSFADSNYKTDVVLTNIRIYKNPSPENPVEIKTVGDKTTNLLDVNAMANDFMVVNDDGSVTFEIVYKDDGTTKTRFSKDLPIYLKANTPYCLEGTIEEGMLEDKDDSNQSVQLLLKDKNGAQIKTTNLAGYNFGSRMFISSTDVYYVSFYLSAGQKGYIRISNLRLVEPTNYLCNIINEPVNEYAEFEVTPYTGEDEFIAWSQYTITPIDGNAETEFLIQYIDASNNVFGSRKLATAINLMDLGLHNARKWRKIRIYAGSTVDASVGKAINFSFSVVVGSHEYEPYGYKIPITAKTKNMIKPVDSVYGYNSAITVEDGKMTVHNLEQEVAGSSYNVCVVPCEFSQGEIGKSYIASWGGSIISTKGNSNLKITFEDDNHKQLWGNWANVKFTLTSPIKQVDFILSRLDDAIQMETPIVMQLEEGTAVTDYESYQKPITTKIFLDEPLRGYTNIHGTEFIYDYMSVADKKVYRRGQEFVFTGNEDWAVHLNKSNTYRVSAPSLGISLSNYGICTHYSKNYSGDIGVKNGIYTSGSWVLIFTDLDCPTLDDFKNYVKTQYENGTPIKVVVRCEEVDYKEETIDLPTLPTFKGTTIYEVGTEVQPSNMEVTYYSSQKGE